MKFFKFCALCAFVIPLTYFVSAQQTPPPAPQPAAQSTPDAEPQPKGTVIFSRSATDDANAATNQAEAAQALLSGDALKAALDAEAKANPTREAERITALTLDLRLQPAQQGLAVRAELTVRNDGKQPLHEIRLAVSSTLHWDTARTTDAQGGQPLKFTQARLHSDADHTGLLNEITLPLAEPLSPGATIKLDLRYSGVIPQAADRLTALGTPDDPARHSEWDRISADFTGLRGYGNVAWYPVAATPVFLGEGAKLFDALADHRRLIAGTDFSLQLTIEYAPGAGDLVAFVNGREVELSKKDAHSDLEVPGIAHGTVAAAHLGFDEPSVFVAPRTLHETGKLRIWMQSNDDSARKDTPDPTDPWRIAASDVEPLLTTWLGQKPDARLSILALPEPADAPFETGALLVTPIEDEQQRGGAARIDSLEMVMAHSLTHAWLASDAANYSARPLWLNEGVAWFISSLWLEKQHGQAAALRMLESGRPALALNEPESPGAGEGEPLARAVRPVYTRNKAGFVFWMLRDVIGDGALSSVLRSELKGDTPSEVETSFEQTLKKAALDHDINWFIRDWLAEDKGLPDLAITGVFPSSSATPGSWLVAVDLANSGYVDAEVKLTVRSATSNETQRLIIPARGKLTPHILIAGRPTEVRLNDGTVPETQATVHIKTIE
jgi:hypothetical protein